MRYISQSLFLACFCLFFWPITLKAGYTSVQGVSVSGDSQVTQVVINLSKKTTIKPVLKEEKIIIDLPEDVVWEAETSLNKAIGRVEGYSIQSGELEVMLKRNTALSDIKYSEDDGSFQVRLILMSSDASKNAQKIIKTPEKQLAKGVALVRNIRVGQQSDKETRIVFDLFVPQDFNANIIGNELVVRPKGGSLGQTSFFLGAIDDKLITGLVESMSIGQFDSIQQLQATLAPGVTIKTSFLIQGDNPRYVIDLVEEGDSKTLESMAPVTEAQEAKVVRDFLTKTETASEVAKNATPDLIVLEKHKAIAEENPLMPLPGGAQEVLRMRIDRHHDVTNVLLELQYPEHFKVTENEYAHQIMVELPKTDWQHVHVHEDHHTDVEHYFVDQSHPNMTVLVIRVPEGITVLDRDVHTHHDKAAFVIELGRTDASRGHWGHNTDENWGRDYAVQREHSAPGKHLAEVRPALLHNEEKSVGQVKPFAFETLKPTYDVGDPFEAGNAPFANVATGIYFGVMAGFSEGRLSTQYTQGSSGNQWGFNKYMGGFDGGVYAGYGHGFDRFYVGGEAFFRYMTAYGQTSLAQASGTKLYDEQAHYQYGLALRLGAYIAPESLLYGKIGVSGLTVKHQPNAAATGEIGFNKSFKHNTAGLFYGLGIETQISSHMSARLEAVHTNFQHYVKGSRTDEVRYAPQLNQISLGVTYKLNAAYGPSSQEGIGIIPTGFYAGSGVDLSVFSVRQRIGQTDGDIFKLRAGAISPAWDFYTGYGVQYGQIYYGVEAMASLGNSYVDETLKQGSNSAKISNKRFSTYGLYFRPGYGFGHGNLIYLKIGGVMSKFKHTSTPSASDLSIGKPFNKAKLGYAIGGGIEAFANDNISVRGEYMVEFYSMNSNSANGLTEDYKMFNNKFQIGVTYTL